MTSETHAVSPTGHPTARPVPPLDRPAGEPGKKQNISNNERWGSMGLGAALVLAGLKTGRLPGLLLTITGGSLVYRGLTGHCYCYEMLGEDTSEHGSATVIPAQAGVHVEKSVNINRSPEELFHFWRDLTNLPKVMRHLKQVEVVDQQRSRWTAYGPLNATVHWEAEIINERENEMIAWRSLPGGDIDTAGSVHFKALGHDRGTAITVSLKYNPPAGKLAEYLASLFGRSLEQEVTEDLRRFKNVMEAGEVPTTHGQPQGNS